MQEDHECGLFGVLVTYCRPERLAQSLERILSQDQVLKALIVVDCDPKGSAEPAINSLRYDACTVEYLRLAENKGPAGGRAAGMRRVLALGDMDDWIMLFDDDDAPPTTTFITELRNVALQSIAADCNTGGVGLRGARFHMQRARTAPVRDFSPQLVRVDHLHGGFFPTYRLHAVEQVGEFAEELFYGFEELEYGLRLTAAGFNLYMAASLYDSVRNLIGHAEPRLHPRARAVAPSWKRYYSLRNLLYILLKAGHPFVACRVFLIRGILKPILNFPLSPSVALSSLRFYCRAARDAAVGRMGRTVEPSGTHQKEK